MTKMTKSNPRDLRPLRHCLHFWQLRTTIWTFIVSLQLRVPGDSIRNSCDVLNVFSNCLPDKMQSHIGCICLTFLHCAFSNVSSKRLQKRMHIHIGCINLTPLYIFKCVLKLLAWEDAESHWLHLFDFSPLCLSYWNYVFGLGLLKIVWLVKHHYHHPTLYWNYVLG